MKLIFFVAALLFSVSASAANFTIDPTHSSVIFKIRHNGVSNVYGRFNDFAGSFVTDDATEQLTQIGVVVKATSIDTNVSRRDNHLRSADFFDAAVFPGIVFNSSNVTLLEDGSYEITGQLSLHGASKNVTLRAGKIGSGQDATGNQRIGGEATLTLKRSDFGMTTMLDSVGDEVTLIIAFEGYTG